jgi:NADH:ubiquinone oxidoreductase subunit 6 (subunit J)
MNEKKGLLSSGLDMVMRNKRYIFWFWLLNLTLAEFGTSGFRQSAHVFLDHSLYAGKLLHGFDASVFGELLAKPDFGQLSSMRYPAFYFGFLFFLATALFLPGVFAGYASTYRLPRDDFFRACGRNLWRFIRILIIAGIVTVIVAAILFSINSMIVNNAEESTNELLPVALQIAGIAVIFLVMTVLRIWFDLAEADTVLNDQRAVRKSIWVALKHTFRGLFRLLTVYVLITMVAAIFLAGGLWAWMKFVAPENWFGAYVIAQITLFLLLIPRFWQRAAAVSYWKQYMLAPVVAVQPVTPQAMPVEVVASPSSPLISPVLSGTPDPSSAADEPAPPLPPSAPDRGST